MTDSWEHMWWDNLHWKRCADSAASGHILVGHETAKPLVLRAGFKGAGTVSAAPGHILVGHESAKPPALRAGFRGAEQLRGPAFQGMAKHSIAHTRFSLGLVTRQGRRTSRVVWGIRTWSPSILNGIALYSI